MSLKRFKIYLAGPITGLTYDGATSWRDFVRDNINLSIDTYSPMRGKQRLKEKEHGGIIKDYYNDDVMTSINGINIRDYNDVITSDVIFVNLLGASKVSIGTVMEIAWAKAHSIPVVLIMEKNGNIHEHSMLTYNVLRVPTVVEGIELTEMILLGDRQIRALEKN